MSARDFRITRDRIEGQPPDEMAWRAIEDIYDELKLPHESDARIEQLTPGQRALYLLHWVQSEIRNGGFEQLVYNTTGRFAAEAPTAARLIGAHEYAAIFDRFNALFPDSVVPEGQGRRRAALREVTAREADEIQSVEDQFFRLLRDSDIYHLMGDYVAAHPNEFLVD
jgi:hypothetical protein